MAIYHFNAKIITRGEGRSAAAAAAYASCSQIYNDYDGLTHDYSKKRGNVYSEIFLPSNAPAEWKDREKLWNAVEAAEKSKDSRLSRELVVSLPIELGLEEWKDILKKFVSENCVDKGMCADVNVHNTDGHNPHAHILLTVRPLDEKGKWAAKTQKEYLCKRGNEEKGFTSEEFKAAQADGWEKLYQYKVGKKKIYMTASEAEPLGYERVSKYPKSTKFGRPNPIAAEWNSEEQLLQWRKAWELTVNDALAKNNQSERINCRSFKERGIKEQPTIYEGTAARIMEKRGFVSERCELNRQIKEDNRLLRALRAEVKRLTELVKNTVSAIAKVLENLRNKLVGVQYDIDFNENLVSEIKNDKLLMDVTLNEYNKTVKRIDDKTKKLKALKSEQKNLSPIHFLRHRELSAQVERLEDEIGELNNIKATFLDRMGFKSEKDVSEYEALIARNDILLEDISAQSAELRKQKADDKAEFLEIRSGITPNNAEAIQAERYGMRNEYMRELSQQIKAKYGSKYSYDILRDAEKFVNDELGEKAPSLKRKLQRDRRRTEENERGRRKKRKLEREQ